MMQVFPPSFRELPPPKLDLFDLDEHFTSEKARLAQLTNKCNLLSPFYNNNYRHHNIYKAPHCRNFIVAGGGRLIGKSG